MARAERLARPGPGVYVLAMPGFVTPPVLSADQAVQRLKDLPRPWAQGYLAMYSSQLQGIVTDPWLMSLPIDDHMVHRGDGVFEAMKALDGRIYQLRAHLERLRRSAESIHLALPGSLRGVGELCRATAAAAGQPDVMVRLYLSRGPGGFTTNPFECPAPGLYIVISKFKPLPEAAYSQGVQVGISRVPAKSGFYASVKCCNYLPNVLLKHEAVSRGWDFSIGLDETGALAEGSTENFGLVSPDGRLLLPPPDHILEGTTARRAVALAPALVERGVLAGVDHTPLTEADLAQAREVMLFGTTLDVLPVTRVEGRSVGQGKPGPVALGLLGLIRDDIRDNPEATTPFLT